MKSKQIMFHDKYDVRLDDFELPQVGDNEIQCVSRRTLISTGTEVICYNRSQDEFMHRKQALKPEPYGMGYSTSAEVIAVGKNVKNFKVGDRVHASTKHKWYFNEDASVCTHTPDWVSDEENAWMTMLRLGLYACRLAELKPTDSILITGLGLFGISALMFAKIHNARNIIVVERDPYRASLAKEYGATHVLADEIGNVTEKVLELNGGRYLDAAIDATAWGGNVWHCQSCVKNSGNIVVIADPPNANNQILNWGHAHYRGQHIHGCFINMQFDTPPEWPGMRESVNHFYPWTLQDCHEFIYEKMKTGEVKVKNLSTKAVSPAEVNEIYKALDEDRSRLLGVQFDWGLLKD